MDPALEDLRALKSEVLTALAEGCERLNLELAGIRQDLAELLQRPGKRAARKVRQRLGRRCNTKPLADEPSTDLRSVLSKFHCPGEPAAALHTPPEELPEEARAVDEAREPSSREPSKEPDKAAAQGSAVLVEVLELPFAAVLPGSGQGGGTGRGRLSPNWRAAGREGSLGLSDGSERSASKGPGLLSPGCLSPSWRRGEAAGREASEMGMSQVSEVASQRPWPRQLSGGAVRETCEALQIMHCRSILREVAEPSETPEKKKSAPADFLPMLCGVLPLQAGVKGRVYQRLVWGLAWLCAAQVAWQAAQGDVRLGDMATALGGVLGLWACGVCSGSSVLFDAMGLLRHVEGVEEASSGKMVLGPALLLWAVAVALRAVQGGAPGTLAFALLGLVNASMACLVQQCCGDMLDAVDSFCVGVSFRLKFDMAVQQWNSIQATCLVVCAAVQKFLVILLAVGGAVISAAVLEVSSKESVPFGLLPALLVALPSLRALFWAAAVTDKCVRVPALVNSLSTELLSAERMHCVQFIRYSEAGFHVFDVRICSASVLRAGYIALAFAVSMMTQLHAILAGA